MLKFLQGVVRRVASQRLLIYNQGKFTEAPIAGELLTDVGSFKRS